MQEQAQTLDAASRTLDVETEAARERSFPSTQPPPQEPSLDNLRGWLYCALLITMPLAFSLRLTSFLLAKELILNSALCLLGVLVVLRGRLPWQGIRAFAPFWLLALVAALVHLTLCTAKVPADAVVEIVRILALLLAVALVFDLLRQSQWRRRLRTALILSAAAVGLMALLQYAGAIAFLLPVYPSYSQRMYSVFGNQDLLGGYMALALPLAVSQFAFAQRVDKLTLAAMPLLLVVLALAGCRSAWIAAAAGCVIAFAQARTRPRRLLVIVAVAVGCLAATTLVAPHATLGRLASITQSADVGSRARLWFWDGTLRMIRDYPLAGVGPGNYAYWSPSYLGESLHAPGGERFYHDQLHVDHAHSEPLEIAAELGLMGVAACAWMLWRVARCRGPELGALTALLVFSLFNAAFRSAPHALAGLLLAAMMLARHGTTRAIGKESEVTPHVLAVPAFVLTAFFLWAVFIPSLRLRAAEDVHVAGGSPLALYERAVAHPWPHATADEKFGIALAEAGRRDEARHRLETSLAGLDTGEVYLALAGVAVQDGDKDAAQRWLRECLWRWPSNRDAWRLLEWANPEADRARLRAESSRWLPPKD